MPTTPTEVQVSKESDDGKVVISGTAPEINDIEKVRPIPTDEAKQLAQQCPGLFEDVLIGAEVEPSNLSLSPPPTTIRFDIGTDHLYGPHDPLTILTIPGCGRGEAEITADIRYAEGKIYHSSIFVLVKLAEEPPIVVVETVEVAEEMPEELPGELLRESIVGIRVIDDYTLDIELAEPDDRIPELIQRWADSEGFAAFEHWVVSDDGLGLTLHLQEGAQTAYEFEEALHAALE